MKAEEALAIAKKYTKDTMIGAGAIKGDKGDKGATGPKGDKGADGTTYTPSIGTVTTVDSGGSASVTVETDDTTKEAVFSFKIPKGDKGESGGEAVGELENAVGDISTLQVASVNDLVSAINLLYNSFMAGVTYADKKLTITYRNGQKFAIDISSIITDTKIGEFSDVSDTGITDGQVLAFDASTSKYVPKSIDTSSVLDDAKSYTDEKIAKMTHMGAISVDAKPTYADGTITYVKGGNTKTTTNTETWFYYTVDGTAYQTIWIDAVEFTVTVSGSVDFADFVSKTNDVTSTYTGKNADKTKIPNIGALDALYKLLSDVIGTKVNASDIVDSLVSDAANKPLSAKQGKTLNTAITGHTSDTDIHIAAAERTAWNKVSEKVDKTSIATSVNSASTDEQVPSAKAVDDRILADRMNVECGGNFSLDTFGITSDNTVTELARAVANWVVSSYGRGKFFILDFWTNNNQSLFAKSLPTNCRSCIGTIKYMPWQQTNRIQVILTDGINGDAWIGSLNNSDTDDIIWKRVCTTNVTDVAKTYITTFDDASSTGSVAYLVKNGICYVHIGVTIPDSSTDYSTLLSNMPKSSMQVRSSLYSSTGGTHNGLLYIDGATLRIRRIANDSGKLYGSLSYPVAEE